MRDRTEAPNTTNRTFLNLRLYIISFDAMLGGVGWERLAVSSLHEQTTDTKLCLGQRAYDWPRLCTLLCTATPYICISHIVAQLNPIASSRRLTAAWLVASGI